MEFDLYGFIEAVILTAVSVLTTFHAIRALIPADKVSIDGKPVIWTALAVMAIVGTYGAVRGDLIDQAAYGLFAGRALLTVCVVWAVDAGVASVDSARTILRTLATLGGRTNAVR